MLGIQSKDANIETWRRFFRDGDAEISPETSVNPSKVVKDGMTTKFLLRMEDGLETESVILPIEGYKKTRQTLCVSSQVGCAMGCEFCQTAQMGLLRNLSVAEIIAQWHAARHALGTPIDNIVFMGMGEPMENIDVVINAIHILTDQNGPSIAPSRICVSTVGRIEGINQLACLARTNGYKRLSLAVSINASNDEVRKQIMPLAKSVSMESLREAMLDYPRHDCGGVMAEYVLIPGVNDSDEHAVEICEFLRPIGCHLNVIPYNPRDNSPWGKPTEDSVRKFISIARSTGQFVRRRITLGQEAMAACGQLGNPALKKKRGQYKLTMSLNKKD